MVEDYSEGKLSRLPGHPKRYTRGRVHRSTLIFTNGNHWTHTLYNWTELINWLRQNLQRPEVACIMISENLWKPIGKDYEDCVELEKEE